MQFDRKLLLIAPTVILAFIVAGMLYTAFQLRVLTTVSESWTERSAFLTSVERGERTLSTRQATGLLRLSLDVERRRTAAIEAAYDVLFALAIMTAACWVVLALGVRRIPREHWPRLNVGTRRRE